MYNLLKFSILLSLALVCAPTATIKPVQPFTPKEDAALMCKAMEDNEHINNEKIIQILTRRTYNQRRQISEAFNKSCPKKWMVTRLKNNLSGLFGDLIYALLTPLPEFYARELYRESFPKNRPSNAILDILSTSSDKEINKINNAYNHLKLSKKSLADILKNPARDKDPQLDFAIEFINSKRKSFKKNQIYNATKTAVWFHTVGYTKNAITRARGDERQTVQIFRESSIVELREIFKAYEELYHHDIENAFEQRGFADDIEQTVLTLIRVIKSKPLYFADRLYDSLRGSKRPNDKALIRIIVGRSEIDLDNIKKEFETKYGRSLTSVIESKDRDKDYLQTLAAIVGPGN